jgi:hypothetical protein
MNHQQSIWDLLVAKKLRRGRILKSRTGRRYKVVDYNDKRFTIQREDSSSTVNITRSKIESTYQRLLQGEALAFQANPSNGGISFTVAIEVGVVWAIKELVNTDKKTKTYTIIKE